MYTSESFEITELEAYCEGWRQGNDVGRFIGIAMMKDFENERLVEENRRFRHEATHDPLTELLNRRGLEESLADRDIEGCIVLYADGTRVHTINNELGHKVGDKAIIGIANILRTTLRAEDVLARVGGDEFLAVIEPVQRDGRFVSVSKQLFDITEDITRRTQALLNENLDLAEHGFDIAVGSAIGHQGMDIDALQETAESNMMLEKAVQHDRFDSQR
jgi:diguanylate cyclase (GGDEF)-like protein